MPESDLINTQPVIEDDIQMQVPDAELGHAVYNLVQNCPPLDTNSMYCNLLQCSHFAETSVAAMRGSELVGFVSGFIVPSRSEKTLFVWQVAVSASARGQGLASRMLDHILQRPVNQGVKYVESTITEDNSASWRLFERLARTRQTRLQRSEMFDKSRHFNRSHASEMLARVGPL